MANDAYTRTVYIDGEPVTVSLDINWDKLFHRMGYRVNKSKLGKSQMMEGIIKAKRVTKR